MCDHRQEVLVPFMSDARFDDDTLFLVFEEDYRFAPTEDDPCRTAHGRREVKVKWAVDPNPEPDNLPVPPPPNSGVWARERVAAQPLPEPTARHAGQQQAAASSSTSIAPKRDAAGRAIRRALESSISVPLERVGAADWNNIPQYLRDVVAYNNLAGRMGKAFVWLGWQPGNLGAVKCKPNRFASGTMLCCLTTAMATELDEEWNGDENKFLHPAGHVDQVLKRFFSKHYDDPQASPACYLAPPLGGYTAHVSGCTAEFGDAPRPSIWGAKWACPGTRREEDWCADGPRDKWWCGFTNPHGHCQWLKKVDVEVSDAEVTWRTFKKVEEEQAVPAEPTAGSAAAWLAAAPAREPELGPRVVPFWNCAPGDDEQKDDEACKPTRRQKRALRKQAGAQGRRCFVETVDEADEHCIVRRDDI
jgi:hypothetical protein